MKKKISFLIRDESGVITVLTVIMMAAFVGLLALVIDLGHLHIVQNELQNASDDCVLRGARGFFADNLTGISSDPPNHGPGTNGAVDKAAAAIGDNKSDNTKLVTLPEADIQVGIWDYTARQLLPWAWPPDPSWWGKAIGPGISLPTQKTDAYNGGPVGMSLAKIFGISTVAVKARATAALSGLAGFTPESPAMPFGPMVPPPTPGPFTGLFRNDNNDTVGWSNLQGVPLGSDPPNTNAKDLKDLLAGKGSPDTGPNHPVVSINNGQIASAIKVMTGKNNQFGLTNDPAVTGSTDPTVYAPDAAHQNNVYLLPIFDKTILGGDPNKFNQSAVVGAIAAKITKVADSPGNYIILDIMAGGYVSTGVGGGTWYGVLSTQPKLVE